MPAVSHPLLHAHFGVDAITAWPVAKALDLPMIVTLHGYDINICRKWWEAGYGGRVMRKYPSRLLDLAKEPRVRFIAVSEAVRRRAMSYGIPAEKLRVHYIGVDTKKFAPGDRSVVERERRVLFVGRLVEKKGYEYLIRASALV
jgi:glycosyltransferase involved in cell wall biosynthesis